MIEIALIPVLGVLLLLGLCLVVLNRRSAKVADARQEVDDCVAAIVEQDRTNDQGLVDGIVGGRPLDECFGRHAALRGKLYPGAHRAPAVWTQDDLQTWRKQHLSQRIESVNRRLLGPALGTSLAVVAFCVVTVAILYSFHSSRPSQPLRLPTTANTTEFPVTAEPLSALSLPQPQPLLSATPLPQVPDPSTEGLVDTPQPMPNAPTVKTTGAAVTEPDRQPTNEQPAPDPDQE